MHDNVVTFIPSSKATRVSDSSIEATAAPSVSPVLQFWPAGAIEKLPKEEKQRIAAEVQRQISHHLEARIPELLSLQEQRAARRDAWRNADTRTDYFWALIRWCETVHVAQREGIEEALRFGSKRFALDGALRISAVRKWREALNLQLLTPAPDLAAVKWKQSNFERSIGLGLRTIERAIADDLAWLEKYPARQRRVRRPRE
jgi:hypothetical protein